ARRDRPGDAQAGGRGGGGPDRSGRHHRGAHRGGARHRRDPGSGPYHPHQRGGAVVQFPAVAGSLCRTDVHSRFLARFLARDLPRRAGALCGPRAAFRRPAAGDDAGSGVVMSRELRLRVVSGIVLAVVVLTATWLGGITFRLLAAAIALLVYS